MIILVIDKTKNLSKRISSFFYSNSSLNECFIYFEKTCLDANLILSSYNVDCIFYNADIDNGENIELLQLNCDKLIVVSRYKKFAYKSIKLGCFNYLLAPIKTNELNIILDVLIKNVREVALEQFENKGIEANKIIHYLIIRVNNVLVRLVEHDIIYLEKEKEILKIYLRSGESYVVSNSMKSFISELTSGVFKRVSKNVYINLSSVSGLVKASDSSYLVKLENEIELPISVPKISVRKYNIFFLDKKLPLVILFGLSFLFQKQLWFGVIF